MLYRVLLGCGGVPRRKTRRNTAYGAALCGCAAVVRYCGVVSYVICVVWYGGVWDLVWCGGLAQCGVRTVVVFGRRVIYYARSLAVRAGVGGMVCVMQWR